MPISDAELLMQQAQVHHEWQQILADALATVDPDYLQSLLQDNSWLPGAGQLLSAFKRDRLGVRYLLIGESPYPRRESANGIAFFDAAVGELWSEQGLSKPVNRATSLRNILKTTLLAEGLLERDNEGKVTQAAIAAIDKHRLVQTLDELFANLQQAGLLMLNATPVLHSERKPVQEARYWYAFLAQLLASIAEQATGQITLLLWGKIAQQVEAMPASKPYRKLVCEHPYNLSFIDNPHMLKLFARISVMQQPAPLGAEHRKQ
jgi:uracil-DNA glycosylase